MCGVGAVITWGSGVESRVVKQMMSLVSHRGPDDDGIREFRRDDLRSDHHLDSGPVWLSLGHTRLAILDPSESSSQPMMSACGRYCLTYNGEIYNYRELRRELESLGVQFRSNGDTEVLMASLIKWGDNALSRLRGMFAFVFADNLTRTVLAARDRYGIKPLYLWEHEERIYFASEIKQFTCLPGWRSKLSQQKALEFLLYGVTDVDSETLFHGVKHVPPGYAVNIDIKTEPRIRYKRWWMPDRSIFGGTYEDAVEMYTSLFKDSLSFHLRSDVAIAACLSGGLDSSAIVGSVDHWFSNSIQTPHTFTAVSDDQSISEVGFAHAMNAYVGAQATEVRPDPMKLWNDLDRIIWHQDEPFGSSSIFAQWCIFEQISAAGFKVALDGQGADEQLAGYNSFITLKILSDFERGRVLRSVTNLIRYTKTGRVSLSEAALAAGNRYLPRSLKKTIGAYAGITSCNPLSWIQQSYARSLTVDPFEISGVQPRTIKELSWRMVDQINLPLLLRFEDRNSMAFGVESRVPFVDHPLMEFALSLPENFVLRDGQTKAVLRDVIKWHVPPAIVRRRDKIGFQLAEASWLHDNRSTVMSKISNSLEAARDIFSPDILAIVENLLASSRSKTQIPWRTLVFLRWMSVFNVSN